MRRQFLAVLALLVLSGCASDPPAPLVDLTEGKPNVILIVVDTFRADHLGAYGNDAVKTPHLDAFAAEAILFEDASSTSTWTLPSVASLYTGREPKAHRAIGAKHRRIDESLPVMAEVLKVRGYATWGQVAVDFLGPSFGMDRGFDNLDTQLHGAVSTRYRSYQSRVAGALSVPPASPWFGLIHFFDAHDPYRPPQPFDGMYYEGDPKKVPDDPSRRIDVIYDTERNRIGMNPEKRYSWLEGIQDLQYPVAQYAAGVTQVDDHLGGLFTRFRDSGRFDDSIVIVVADHGEHLTEHDLYFTHRFPYAETLHVPLMIRLPGGVQGGRRVTEPVSVVDVLPTLMELIGEPLESAVDGISLVGAMRGEPIEERLLFAEFGSGARVWAKSVWNADWRYTEIKDKKVRTAELFDRRADPREENDVAAERSDVVETFRAALDLHYGTERRWVDTGESKAVPIDEETAERLRALGYIE